MPAGATRIVPFLVVSAALHAVAFVTAGPERLSIAPAPAGDGHTVSISLVAAGRPGEPQTSERTAGRGEAPAAASRSRAQPEPASGPPSPAMEASAPPEVGAAEDGAGRPGDPETRQNVAAKAPAAGTRTERAAPGPRSRGSSSHEEATAASSETAAQEALADASNRKAEPDDQARTRADAGGATAGTEPGRRDGPSRALARRTDDAAGDADPASTPTGGDGGRARASARAERVRAEIASRLARYFRYPRLAQRQGWEGRVVLGFRVRADGTITDVRVIESSGRAILDQAAMQALRKVERVPGIAAETSAGGLALKLPVTYRLQSA